MFQLTPLIQKILGKFYIAKDSNKDINGKGIVQRYNELLADEWDNNFLQLADNLQSATIDPNTIDPRFLAYLEDSLGGIVKISTDVNVRKKLIKYSSLLYQIKGTKPCYEILFKLLGFITVEIIEYPAGGGFDTWYDAGGSFDITTFDTACPTCSGYSLVLTGSVPNTPDFIKAVYNIIEFCQPINADLVSVTYNGDSILDDVVQVAIDTNGNLQFDNSLALATFMYLSALGDLMIYGTNADRYFINEVGDLIFMM